MNQQTFLSIHGKYLCAEPDGSVVANRDAAGPYETWTIEVLGKDTVALKSVHGKYFCAEPDGSVVANRDAAGPYETWTVTSNGDKTGSLKSIHGKYLCAEPDGSVVANRDAIGAYETWASQLFAPIVVVDPLPAFRTGRVRLEGKCFADDQGPYNALGASLFWAVRGMRSDRERTIANLRWLRSRGVDFVRVFGETSDWSENCNTDPRWPDYVNCLRLVRDVCAGFGLRIGWTVFGGNKLSRTEQDKCFADVMTVCDERPDVVQYIEISNENNGFSGAPERMRAYCKTAAQHGFQVTLTSAPHASNIYEGSAATFATVHFDRAMGDNGWRPVRQPWGYPGEYGNVPKAFISGEPIGPGSSVAQDTDTLRLSQNALHTWLCGGAAHVVHYGAGIYGIPTQHPVGGPRPANVWEQVSLEETLKIIGTLRKLLPVDLANWQRTRHGLNEHPFNFVPDALTAVGDNAMAAGQGCVRAYAAYRGGRYVCALIGIMKTLSMTPHHATSWTLMNAVDGREMRSGTGPLNVLEVAYGRAVLVTGNYQ